MKSALGGIHVVQNAEASLYVRLADAEWFRPSLMVQYFDGTGLMPNAASRMR